MSRTPKGSGQTKGTNYLRKAGTSLRSAYGTNALMQPPKSTLVSLYTTQHNRFIDGRGVSLQSGSWLHRSVYRLTRRVLQTVLPRLPHCWRTRCFSVPCSSLPPQQVVLFRCRLCSPKPRRASHFKNTMSTNI